MRRKAVRRNKQISRHIKSRNKKLQKNNRLQSQTEGWDRSLSFTQNLDNLGMNNRKVNEIITDITQNGADRGGELGSIQVEEVTIEQLNKMRLQAEGTVEKKKNKVKLNQDDQWAVEGSFKKYGIDFRKWEKDHKVNTFQWTAIQCKNKHEQYVKKYGQCPKKSRQE